MVTLYSLQRELEVVRLCAPVDGPTWSQRCRQAEQQGKELIVLEVNRGESPLSAEMQLIDDELLHEMSLRTEHID